MDKLYKFEDFVEEFVDESISEKDKEWLWLGWQAAWNSRVPEGYVVVPREPTEKMIYAYYNCGEDLYSPSLLEGYEAMIAAAEEE